MDTTSGIHSLPTEIHTEILLYLSDNLVDQIVASCILPVWGDIIRDSPRLQRSRYVSFQSMWQNTVAIHKAIGQSSGNFALCCAVRNKTIEKYSMAWKPPYPVDDVENRGIIDSMDDMGQSWSEIDITDNFLLDEYFLLPFRGTLARDLKLSDKDIPVSELRFESDLRTTFVKAKIERYTSSGLTKLLRKQSVIPSHTGGMNLRKLLQFFARRADSGLQKEGFDIGKLHYVKVWPDDDVTVTAYPAQDDQKEIWDV